MASHTAYPHLLPSHPHPQSSSHLPPPPQSSVAQTPDLRLPSLRSLNFAYPPVGEPGTTTVDPISQPQQRVEQQPRTSYAQQDEYYHQRDMPYYPDASSSQAPSSPSRRGRSDSGARSPYAMQPSPTTYETQRGAYTQPAPQYEQTPSFYNTRVSQPSQAWYFQQTQPSQPQQQQQPHQPPPHQHQPQHHQQPHAPPQHQQPQKHSLHFASYTSTTSPHAHPRASFPTAPVQAATSPVTAPNVILAGPGTTAGAAPGFNSPPTSNYSSLSNANTSSRSVDKKTLSEEAERAAAEGLHLSKIKEHSKVLCDFANHYAQMPLIRPTPTEVAEMAHRASLVLQLVDHLRRLASSMAPTGPATSPLAIGGDKERDRERDGEDRTDRMKPGSKKRPWEDHLAPDSGTDDGMAERAGDDNSLGAYEGKDSLAEKDMAIIRSKRGQGSANGGQQGMKAKYRKRSRASPPGKCHSCNIRETPEWRRGPDGARTLCNACGLHYAKLIRKRDKTLGPDGNADAPPIDLEMLRASTRVGGDQSKPSPGPMHGPGDVGFRNTGPGDMAEIQLQPVPGPVSSQRGAPPSIPSQMGVGMQVHHWNSSFPTQTHRDDNSIELAAYSTSLMRSSNARGSPT